MLLAGRYRIEQEVARSRTSAVARGVDEHTGTAVAIKVHRASANEAMLWAELRQLQRVPHPALPRVVDLGRLEAPWGTLGAKSLYLVTEWIAGQTVAELRGTPRGPQETVEAVLTLLRDVGAALGHMHAAGLLHRDVAPRNLKWDASAGRAFLMDLGLARDMDEPLDEETAGTLAYLAPEALVGQPEPVSDLYGLGACVVELVTGRALFSAGDDVPALLRAIVVGAEAPTLPELPTALAALVRALVAADPSARPPSAAAMLEQLEAGVRTFAPHRARPVAVASPDGRLDGPHGHAVVGRELLVHALADRLTAPGLTVLVGDAARGGAAVAEAATALMARGRLAAGHPAPPRLAGRLDALARRLGAPADPSAVIALARATPSAQVPGALLVIDAIDDERGAALVRALWRPGLSAAVIALVDQARAERLALPLTRELGASDRPCALALEPLGPAQLAALWRSLQGREPTATELDELTAHSGGEPAIAAALAAGRLDRPLDADGWRHLWQRAPAAVQRLLCAAALWPDGVSVDLLLAVVEDEGLGLAEVARACALGMARRRPAFGAAPLLSVREPLAAIALSWLGDSGRAALALRAAAAAERTSAPLGLRAAPLLHVPADQLDRPVAVAVARALADEGSPALADALARHVERALADADAEGLARAVARLRAELAFERGEYEAVDALAAGADDPETRLVAAKALGRRGLRGQALAALDELAAAGGPVAGQAALARARVHLSAGELPLAEALAEGASAEAPERAEVLGLVALYRGELDDADRRFAAGEQAATLCGDRIALGRAMSLRGMVAQQRGQLALAGERYAAAAELLAAARQAHAAATADLNLGTTLTERGRFGDALAHLAAAGLVFSSLGARADWVAAEINRGNCLLAVGDGPGARRAIEAALADGAASPILRAFGELTLAEVERRGGELTAAAARCRQVIDAHPADAHAQVFAQLGLAECGHGLSHDELDALATSDDDRQRIALAVARRALVTGAPLAQRSAAAATASAVAQRALAADRQERAFRAFAVAAQLADGAGDVGAAGLAQRAIAAHGALVAAAPAVMATAMLADPDRRAVDAIAVARATPPRATAQAAPIRGDDATARRLLALSLRIHREAELARILDEVIDTAIELARAERGFLLLRGEGGRLEAVVARNFSAAAASSGDEISRSIAERAAQLGEPVVTIDAGLDARFDTAQSVAALRLRSVLAVPMRQAGVAIGCIYVDHRLRRGAFDERAAAVLSELGDIAAIAIGNAQLTAELRQRGAEIEHLNRVLAAELADRDAELVRVRAAAPSRALRGRYEEIAGASEAITRMLALVDRAASTSFPVVIVGESGTGKELVARALHDSSARRAGPFVAVNCSALPDTLLESELFGHVRGAFTGADRERRGMFEVAHGGTLFLDEIADTSAAMQARLLRVLQDGVVRRLGESAVTKVDVRVIAAGQRPLDELVAAGRFREDLRYRLEVLSIAVPPLRERAGDVPILVEHLLRKLCAEQALTKPPRVSRAALRALTAYGWPGNVRELANAISHGLAMAGDDHDVIELGDLPAPIAQATTRAKDLPVAATPTDGDLRLRPALLATERAYVHAAMERTAGNQTAAAKLLGLSRFGLQKKLRRLERNDDADDEDDERSE